MEEPTTAGASFARSLAAKDFEGIAELMHPQVEFRALTPRRHWQGDDPAGACEVLRTWFADDVTIEGLERLETDAFADRERAGYRFAVTKPEGRFLIEQQAYLSLRDGKIAWLRVLCSGFRPAPGG